MRLLSNFFLNGAWLARAERNGIGLYFMLGRTRFVLVVDAREFYEAKSKRIHTFLGMSRETTWVNVNS